MKTLKKARVLLCFPFELLECVKTRPRAGDHWKFSIEIGEIDWKQV